MKAIVSEYSFDAAGKKVTFTDFPTIDLSRVLLITNVTDNIIIYNFANSALGATVAANVLTLDYNTTTMSNDDVLQIFYDFSDASLSDILHELRRMNTKIGPLDTTWRVRTVTDLNTGGVVTATTNFNTTSSGSYNLVYVPFNLMQMAWGNLRSKIEVS